jgi:hypothetical protein
VKYKETPTTIAVTDLNGLPCSTDTGDYSVAYAGNTVTFTITNETCISRGYFFFASGPFTQTNVSVFEAAKLEMRKLYPNPANDVINLYINQDFDGENYVIFNIQGQAVLEGTLSSGKNTV